MENNNQVLASDINHLRRKMSQFMSPYSDTSKLKRGAVYTPTSDKKYPFIKIVSFGTGSGKTYGALENFIMLVKEMNNEMRAAGRSYKDGFFTNAVFTTPTKNQIKFSQKHLADMRNEGITPLSVLGMGDLTNGDTKLWGGGTISLSDRLTDYEAVIKRIFELIPDKSESDDNLEYWHKRHIGLLKSSISSAKSSFRNISELATKLEYAQKDEEEDIKNEYKAAQAKHTALIERLVLDVLNNQIKRDKSDDEDEDEDDEGEQLGLDEDISPIKTSFNNNNFKKPSTKFSQKNSPMSNNEVYDHIFAPAIKKINFDDSVSHITASCNEWWVLLATLKMDIIRIYAPLNYCCYNPSLLCMTSDKFRMTPNFYRTGYQAHGKSWTKDADSQNFSELLGGKNHFGEPILYQPPGERIKHLEKTLLGIRCVEVDCNSKEYREVDKRTYYQKKDINFFVMHDEASDYYAKEAEGSDGMVGREGVIKSVLDDLSMTDILSTVARKIDELFNNDPKNVTAYQQTNAFYDCMCEYLDKYCEIDKVDVFKGFFVDYSPPNVLYIDNSDASTVINVIRNAFSIQAKSFFDKRTLKSVYLNKRGQQSYLSVTPDPTQRVNITLYDLYQIILSILYAAIFFDEDTQFYVDPSNVKAGKLTPTVARNLFALSLGYDKKDKAKDDRQNRSLGKLVAKTKPASDRYKRFLRFESMDNDSDMPIDLWFAYLQTKMVFILVPGGSEAFQRSPAFEDQQKTHLDLQIKLVTHHPEIELLKLTYGTRNMVHLMSATSGKITPKAEQFDIQFLAKYGKPLGVNVFMPTYDHHHKIDYAATSLELQNTRLKTRDLSVVNYDDNNDLFKLIDLPAPIQMSLVDPDQNISPKQLAKKHYADLLGHLNKINHSFYKDSQVAYLDKQSPLYEFFKRSVLSLMVAASTQESMLSLSLSSHAVKILKASILDCCQSQGLSTKINTALASNSRKISFNHEVFGRFELPLLNDWLTKQALKPNQRDDIDDWTVKNRVESEWCYLIDLIDYAKKLNPSQKGIMRLALYDSNIAKTLPDYKEWFIKDTVTVKGEDYPIFTVLLSYFKIAGTGLNNTVFNTLTGKNEDIQNLFLSAEPFYSVINKNVKKSGDIFYQYAFNGFSKTSNSLIRQRQISSDPLRKEVTISTFDATLSSFESKQQLDFEHLVIIFDVIRQLLGRIEREDCPKGFVSRIIVPTSLSLAYAKAAHMLYNFDHKGEPTQNHLDYKLQSLNSRFLLNESQKLLLPLTLTKEARSTLVSVTEESSAELTVFSNEFVRDATIAARAGDEDAIEFSLRYHEAIILFDTTAWLRILKDLPWITSRSDAAELRNTIDKMVVNLADYSEFDIELYQTTNNGLTDFYGQHATTRPYDPIKICLPDIGANYLYKNSDARLLSVIRFSNELTDPTSELYNIASLKRNPKIILHPVMLSIALGNMAERLFKKFLDVYQGGYYELPGKCFSERYGYQFFELFDFWLNVGGTWVCIDTKNYGGQENSLRTQKIYDRAEDKLQKIISHAKVNSGDNSLFFESSALHVIYLNMRVKDGDINPQTKTDVTVNGKRLTVHSHHLNFFQAIQWIDFDQRNEKKENRKSGRKWIITINANLLQLLNIKSDSKFGTGFKPVVDIDETLENAALARLTKPSNATTEDDIDDSK